MRYKLRTLLILLAIGPPMLAGALLLWQWHSALPREGEIIVEDWMETASGWKRLDPSDSPFTRN